MSPIIKHQFKAGDVVIIANPHPVHQFGGFNPKTIRGVRAKIDGPAITEWGVPAWRLFFKHPVSNRDVIASLPEACFEPADYDRISFYVTSGKMFVFMHAGDKLRAESEVTGDKVIRPFGDVYPEILACVTGEDTGIVHVCGVEIPAGVKQ